MIYTSHFKNRVGDAISVKFDTKESEVLISASDLTVDDSRFCSVVHEHTIAQYNLGTKKVTIEETILNNKLIEIRLFKGKTISIAKSVGAAGRYIITDLKKEIGIQSEMLTVGTVLNYTPTKDGYLLINITGNTNRISGNTTRQEAVDNLIFSEEPVTITTKSNGFFSPLKLSGATVRLMTQDIAPFLYAVRYDSIKCTIDNNSTGTNLFRGYVTPCIYSQDYATPYEELEIECISAFSILENVKYRESLNSIVSWYDIIRDIFTATGFEEYDSISILDCYTLKTDSVWLNGLSIDQLAFYKDDEYTDLKSILEQFCKMFGMCFTEIKGEIYLIDPRALNPTSTFTRYIFDDDATEVATIPREIVEYVHNKQDQKISFDDVYGKIKTSCKVEEKKDTLIDIDDNLQCLHPNINYIVVSSNDSGIYKDTSLTHYDLYRFYIKKDCKHLIYLSNYVANTSSGFGSALIFSTSMISSWWNTTNQNTWYSNFMNFLRSRLMCVVVKRFSYSSGTDSESSVQRAPSSYKWETNLLFSYGTKGIGLGDCTTSYDSTYSRNLYNHYVQARNLPVLETTYNNSVIVFPQSTNYLEVKGNAYFIANTHYLNTDGDRIKQDLVTDSSSVYSSPTYRNTKALTYVNYNGLNKLIWYYYKIDYTDRTKCHTAASEYPFNWIPIDESYRTYTENIPELNGELIPINSPFNSTISINAPSPCIISNNVQINFSLMKDFSVYLAVSYETEKAIEGQRITDEVENSVDTGANKEEIKIDLDYGTLAINRELMKNALLFNNAGGLTYLDGENTYNGSGASLELALLGKYMLHYRSPKIIYNLSYLAHDPQTKNSINIDSLHNGTLIDLEFANEFRTFIVDEIDYNLLDASKNVKLIEK